MDASTEYFDGLQRSSVILISPNRIRRNLKMWISPNKHRVKVGDRIKLTNHLSQENLPIGLLGTATHVNEGTYNLHIHMKWDNGSTLALLETDSDCYEIIKEEK